jgi:outer membrane protein TolC
MTRRKNCLLAAGALCLAVAGGCAGPKPAPVARPSIAPASATASGLALDGARAEPMYRELLAVDLPTVVGVAQASNIDIRQAKLNVEAAQGQAERSFGAIFPVIAPGLAFESVDGSVRAVNGPLLGADFSSLAPSVLVQWALNPGKVYYDIVASRKRLEATEHQEQFVVQDMLRVAVVQYYELVLMQARLSVARQAVTESEELLRINELRLRAGAGTDTDRLRAIAQVARRQQDLTTAINNFYNASIALAVTLHMDAAVTLVPLPRQVEQVTLVDPSSEIEKLLSLAVTWRDDLRGVRTLMGAAEADLGGRTWGALGPQLQVGYQIGGVSSDTPKENFSLTEQRRLSASAGWAFGLAMLGDLKTAGAVQKAAVLDAEQQLDRVRAQVIAAAQASSMNAKLIPMARQQLEANEAALKLAQANLKAGTMLTLDVLQAEDAVSEARLRFADAVIRYNQSQVELLAALGLVDAAALNGGQATTLTGQPGPATQPVPGVP